MLRVCDADDCDVQFDMRAAHHRFHAAACKDRERKRQRRLKADGYEVTVPDVRAMPTRQRTALGVSPLDGPRFEHVLIVNDTQFPYTDMKLWDAICWIAEQRASKGQLDGIVWGGDMLDFTQLSSFDFNPYQQVSAHDDVTAFNRDVRQPLVDAAGSAWHVWLDGNHENRAVRSLVCKAPEFLSDTTMIDLLRLPDDWDYVPYGRNVGWWLAEDLLVAHGWAASKHSAATAKKHVEEAGMSVMHGHSHRIGQYFKTTPQGTMMGLEMGHMTEAGRVPGFHGGGVPDWQQSGGTSVVLDSESGAWQAATLPVVGRRGDRRIIVPDLNVEVKLD